MEKLNSIVWPEIHRLAMEKVELAKQSNSSVVVLDAAILLEAGWNNFVHEVWLCIIPVIEVKIYLRVFLYCFFFTILIL